MSYQTIDERLCYYEVKRVITMKRNEVYGINTTQDNIEMKKNVVYEMTNHCFVIIANAIYNTSLSRFKWLTNNRSPITFCSDSYGKDNLAPLVHHVLPEK